MRITHPRLANALHESTNIQTVLEKNDEDLIEYFKTFIIRIMSYNVIHILNYL